MNKKEKEENLLVEADAQPKKVTPYDTIYAENESYKSEEDKKDGGDYPQINLSFSVSSLSSIIAITSLAFTFLYAVLVCFGVNVEGVTRGVFFMFTTILAVASLVFAYKSSKNKLSMQLAFSVFAILVTVMVYL